MRLRSARAPRYALSHRTLGALGGVGLGFMVAYGWVVGGEARAARAGDGTGVAVAAGSKAAGSEEAGSEAMGSEEAGSEVPRATLRVRVRATRAVGGMVRCALFASKRGFPMDADRAFRKTQTPDAADETVCRFERVPPGRYAVAVHHDENDDGKLQRGLFGAPSEGYGASNDAKGTLGPPSFEAAAFRLQADREIVLHMRY